MYVCLSAMFINLPVTFNNISLVFSLNTMTTGSINSRVQWLCPNLCAATVTLARWTVILAPSHSPPSAEFVYDWELWIPSHFNLQFVLRDDVLETCLVFDSVGERLLIKSLQISVFALQSIFWHGWCLGMVNVWHATLYKDL